MSVVANNSKPRVILGLMLFGPDEASNTHRVTDINQYKKILDHFQAEGFNEVDTARGYVNGKQEAFTREAGWKERGLKLATKCYPTNEGDHAPEKVIASCEKSLNELGTDCVDIFYLHAPDRATPFEPTLRACNDLHKQGKFVQLGLSNFTAPEVAEVVMMCKHNNWVLPTVYQVQYNFITRGIEANLVPTCRRFGLDIVVYRPMAGGLFSGRYKTSDLPPEGRFSNNISSGAALRRRYFKDSTWDALRVIEPVVEKHGLTLIETSLRWLAHHSKLRFQDGNDGVIVGVTKIEQLEGNLRDLQKGPLPEDVLAALDEAWMLCKAEESNYWHGDSYVYGYDTKKAIFG